VKSAIFDNGVRFIVGVGFMFGWGNLNRIERSFLYGRNLVMLYPEIVYAGKFTISVKRSSHKGIPTVL
jgi:hypothetical protein